MNFRHDCFNGAFSLVYCALISYWGWWLKVVAVFLTMVTFTVQAAPNQSIKIVTEYIPPYQFYDKDNQLTGLSVEVVRLLLKSVGNADNPIKVMPWPSAYDLALKKPNVMIFSIARSRKREKQFKWVGDILKQHYYFIALKRREDIRVYNIQDVKRFTIGVAAASYELDVLRRYGFANKQNLKITTEQMPLIHLLLDGKVDMIFGFKTTLIGLMEYLKQDIGQFKLAYQIKEPPVSFGIAFSQATDDKLVDRYRNAYHKLKVRGQLNKVLNKWLQVNKAVKASAK